MSLLEYVISDPMTNKDPLGLTTLLPWTIAYACPPRDCKFTKVKASIDVDDMDVSCFPDCVAEELVEEYFENYFEDSSQPDPCNSLVVGGLSTCRCYDETPDVQNLVDICGSVEEVNEVIGATNAALDSLHIPIQFQYVDVAGSFLGFDYDLTGAEFCMTLKLITRDGHCRFMR
jgi:hypothetical protein